MNCKSCEFFFCYFCSSRSRECCGVARGCLYDASLLLLLLMPRPSTQPVCVCVCVCKKRAPEREKIQEKNEKRGPKFKNFPSLSDLGCLFRTHTHFSLFFTLSCVLQMWEKSAFRSLRALMQFYHPNPPSSLCAWIDTHPGRLIPLSLHFHVCEDGWQALRQTKNLTWKFCCCCLSMLLKCATRKMHKPRPVGR